LICGDACVSLPVPEGRPSWRTSFSSAASAMAKARPTRRRSSHPMPSMPSGATTEALWSCSARRLSAMPSPNPPTAPPIHHAGGRAKRQTRSPICCAARWASDWLKPFRAPSWRRRGPARCPTNGPGRRGRGSWCSFRGVVVVRWTRLGDHAGPFRLVHIGDTYNRSPPTPCRIGFATPGSATSRSPPGAAINAGAPSRAPQR
jgi:hypothetical protein